MALDVIGRVVLDVELDSQRRSNALVDGLRDQTRWLLFGGEANPLAVLNPVRYVMRRYNTWRMNHFLYPEVDGRLASFQTTERTKSILDLALSTYFATSTENDTSERKSFDKSTESELKKFVVAQVKQFMFSGHDTTSSAICYLFYALSQNAVALSRIRAEHDKVFSTDLEQAAAMLSKEPSRLNKLPYTLAIIKETLRLYPPVSSPREGQTGFNVRDDEGHQFPTAGFMVWGNPQTIHRDPAYWPSPDEFIPERWIVPPEDPLHPVKGAWRAFEWGPRNCIGQDLAMNEMKIILVLTIRRFSIIPAYDEVDKTSKVTGRTVYGEGGYQIQRA